MTPFEKYNNPDPRCDYPFESCGAGYCWSYAHHVDGNPAFKDMEKVCPGCECWFPERTVKVDYEEHEE